MSFRQENPPERPISRKELAAYLGVHVNTIDNWTRAGMPSTFIGTRLRRFKLSEALSWAETRHVCEDHLTNKEPRQLDRRATGAIHREGDPDAVQTLSQFALRKRSKR